MIAIETLKIYFQILYCLLIPVPNVLKLECYFDFYLQAWNVWTSACLVKTEEKEKMRVASRFYDKTLLLRVWRGLKNYKSVRKLKQLRHGRCIFKKRLGHWGC